MRVLANKTDSVRLIGLRPMHERPKAGRRLLVLMRDGDLLTCTATMIVSAEGAGISIYHGRKVIDENKAQGWWPTRKVAPSHTPPPATSKGGAE